MGVEAVMIVDGSREPCMAALCTSPPVSRPSERGFRHAEQLEVDVEAVAGAAMGKPIRGRCSDGDRVAPL
jgi:hypothetical protein